MARDWDGLSNDYRHRLESHGISRNEYESGANLSSARGHVSRSDLVNEIQGMKADMFADKRRWNEEKSLKHIEKNSDGERRSVSELKAIATALRDTRSENNGDWMDSAFYQLREDDLE